MRHQLTSDADIPLPAFIIESLNQANKRDYGLTAQHRSLGPGTVESWSRLACEVVVPRFGWCACRVSTASVGGGWFRTGVFKFMA